MVDSPLIRRIEAKGKRSRVVRPKGKVILGVLIYILGTGVCLGIFTHKVDVSDIVVRGSFHIEDTIPSGVTNLIINFPGSGPEYLSVKISIPERNLTENFTLQLFSGLTNGYRNIVWEWFIPTFPHFQFDNPEGAPLAYSIDVKPNNPTDTYGIRTIFNYNADRWGGVIILLSSFILGSIFISVTLVIFFAHSRTLIRNSPIKKKFYAFIVLLLITIILAAINLYNTFFLILLPGG